MAANWNALRQYLSAQGDRVVLTWEELEHIVGGMPASAVNHVAFWSGDRPHTRAWRAAGFELESRKPGRLVTFRRVGSSAPEPAPPSVAGPQRVVLEAPTVSAGAGRLILVACSKKKLDRPAAVRDLYSSPRFTKARKYAEGTGDPWFVLSAEHGLVAPDEWLAPYDRYLPDTPRDYRRAWGEWVVARLEMLAGSLTGVTVEVHAGEAYAAPLMPALDQRGATVSRPLAGLPMDSWQGWYDAIAAPPAPDPTATYTDSIDPWVAQLGDVNQAIEPARLAELERSRLDGPGLYSWFVDGLGAKDLESGLGVSVEPGLIYIGQTGATKWPTGGRSASTLMRRIRSQHLSGRRSASTLRRTIGSVLDAAWCREVSRQELTGWMHEHLRVVPMVASDPDTLGDLERQVVQELDPPLNLDHSGPSPVRTSLKRLRSSSTVKH